MQLLAPVFYYLEVDVKKVKFLRINDVSETDAVTVNRHFSVSADNKPAELAQYDYSLVHMLSSQEWMTVEEVVAETENYNTQHPNDSTWCADPGYIALSLIKMVECGLANVRIERLPMH